MRFEKSRSYTTFLATFLTTLAVANEVEYLATGHSPIFKGHQSVEYVEGCGLYEFSPRTDLGLLPGPAFNGETPTKPQHSEHRSHLPKPRLNNQADHPHPKHDPNTSPAGAIGMDPLSSPAIDQSIAAWCAPYALGAEVSPPEPDVYAGDDLPNLAPPAHSSMTGKTVPVEQIDPIG